MSALQRLSNLSSPLMLLQSDILDKSAEDEDVKTTMTRFSFQSAGDRKTNDGTPENIKTAFGECEFGWTRQNKFLESRHPARERQE